MNALKICERLDDAGLLESLKRAVREERRVLAVVLAHLIAVESRKLHEEEGFSSLFVCCAQALGYSEGAADERIRVARAAARFPRILDALSRGRIHPAAVVILAPHLTSENHQGLIRRAAGKSKREVESIAARLAPRTDAAERVRFGFSGDEELRRKLERVRELMRHKHPSGRLEELVEGLADFFLRRKDPGSCVRRIGRRTSRTRRAHGADGESARSRYIPQRVREMVWRRDGGRCAFAAKNGQRCSERGGLEFDHIIPWALGGRSDCADNIRLLCRAHNRNASRKFFGGRFGMV